MTELFGALFVITAIAVFVIGGIRTFQRSWGWALLLLLFLPGIWAIWALIELFADQPGPKIHNVSGTVNDAVANTGDKNE